MNIGIMILDLLAFAQCHDLEDYLRRQTGNLHHTREEPMCLILI